MSIKHHLKKHNSGWLWPLIGVLVVVLLIWWVAGNGVAAPPSGNGTTTSPQTVTVHPAPAKGTTATDVASVAAGVSNGTIFSSWLRSTGVASELKGSGPYTLFLPTDAAIGQLVPGTFKNLSPAEQKRFVENHVISGKVIDINAEISGTVQTLSRDPLNFTRRSGQPSLVGSSIILAEYKASNGVVYLINGVLIPPQRPR